MAGVTLLKLDDDDDLSADDEVMIAKLVRDGPPKPGADPEIDRLVAQTMADIRKSRQGANPVPISKSTGAPTMTAAQHEAEIAKLEARLATTNANRAALEAMELIAKRDPKSTAKAGEILRGSPEAYDAYQSLQRGERWQAPVRKAEDNLSSIERSVAEGKVRLAEITKAKADEEKLAQAKTKLRGALDKLRSRKDTQVAEARQELAKLLATAEGRAALYDLAIIGQIAVAA